MNPRLLIVSDERELRTWLRHHIEILWPDAAVQEMEPAQLQLPAASVSKKDLDLIVLGAQCGEAPEDPLAFDCGHRGATREQGGVIAGGERLHLIKDIVGRCACRERP